MYSCRKLGFYFGKLLIVSLFCFLFLFNFRILASVKLTILKQPKSINALYVGEEVTFHVDVNKSSKYEWQYKKNGSWKNFKDNKDITILYNDLEIISKPKYNNIKIRCKVSSNGKSIYSKTAKLKINLKPYIIKQPGIKKTRMGGQVTYNIVVKGGKLHYQWQYSKGKNSEWINIKGANTKNFTTNTITEENFNWRYRCIIKSKTTEKKVITDVVSPIVTNKDLKREHIDNKYTRGLLQPLFKDGYVYVCGAYTLYNKYLKIAVDMLDSLTKGLFVYTENSNIADIIVVDYDNGIIYPETIPYFRNDPTVSRDLVSKDAEGWVGVSFSDDNTFEHYLVALNRSWVNYYLNLEERYIVYIILHELGHCIGIGHSKDPQSVMYKSIDWNVLLNGLTEEDKKIFLLQSNKVRALSNF